MFAGKEVSRALGLMSLEAEDCCGELADLTPRQLEVLDEWVAKFRGKYHVVGRVGHHAVDRPHLSRIAMVTMAPPSPGACQTHAMENPVN